MPPLASPHYTYENRQMLSSGNTSCVSLVLDTCLISRDIHCAANIVDTLGGKPQQEIEQHRQSMMSDAEQILHIAFTEYIYHR